MSNDDKWDAEVFDATQVQNPGSIFGVSDDLRAQVRYWKDRRNDCAHSKRNAITAAHVEALWAFLRSNLDKFQVGGSTEDLVARIRAHFDPNLTPPSAPCDDLARAIDTTVPLGRRAGFFESVGDLFKRAIGTSHYWVADASRFFESVLRVGSLEVVSEARGFLLANEEALFAMLLAYPQHSHILQGAPEATRKLWRTGLCSRGSDSTALYASLVRNDLIPHGDLAEAHSHMVDSAFLPPPQNALDFDALNRSGYFAVFRKRAFVDQQIDRFVWGNPNAALAAYYLAAFPIDDEIAGALVSVFYSTPYPNTARDALFALLSGTPAKHSELAAAVLRLGRPWPEPLLGPAPA